MDSRTTYTPAELCELYDQTGTRPPEWLLRKAGLLRLSGAELFAKCVEAGVPEAYAGAEPDAARAERARAGTSFYVHGTSGDGKTTVAAGIAAGWLAAGVGSARWVSSMRLLSEIGDTYGGRGSEVAVVGRYAGCGLLVIDDLGKERPGEWALSKLFWLIDERYANRRPTVITTQYGGRALAERLTAGGTAASAETAQAIVSRIREAYRGIDCGAEDRRLRRGKD